MKPDCEITTDGTLIHAADRCIYSCEFTAEAANGVVRELLKSASGAEITVANGKTVYWNSKPIAESEKLHKAVYFEYDRPLECGANKIVAELPDERIARINSAVSCNATAARTGTDFCRRVQERQRL
ncbi:hypothetical protein SAMN04487860_11752 [Ruminococcus flavefaciens]|uniref:Uncharacterized protein n=1 Tax=Ruminococcus flavefaciens TaxID=1265 RepID=A0A1M7M018_RUMFL|nr:hypothetical protein SAMN04487860_11752 [Ruminococcus flavefaciens]